MECYKRQILGADRVFGEAHFSHGGRYRLCVPRVGPPRDAKQDRARPGEAAVGLSGGPNAVGARPGPVLDDTARRIATLRPDIAPALSTITDLYVALRYGHGGMTELTRFRQAVLRFRPSRRATDTYVS